MKHCILNKSHCSNHYNCRLISYGCSEAAALKTAFNTETPIDLMHYGNNEISSIVMNFMKGLADIWAALDFWLTLSQEVGLVKNLKTLWDSGAVVQMWTIKNRTKRVYLLLKCLVRLSSYQPCLRAQCRRLTQRGSQALKHNYNSPLIIIMPGC